MTSEGCRDLPFKRYLQYLQFIDVDSFVTFNDEVPLAIGKRRGRQSVTRNIDWLQKQLATPEQHGRIIANIQVTENPQLLQQQLEIVSQNVEKFYGIHVSGLYLGETPQQRTSLLNTIYSSVPADLVRFITGPITPSEVLQEFLLGSDVTVSSYPVTLAESAYASW